MRYPYVTADVFTDRTFGGNPLAVITDASGLSGEQMQKIAREFNYAETTFVLPPEAPGTIKRVRIFTPMAEVPFAGHPNVGTAVVLAQSGALGTVDDGSRIIFDELAGPVPITLKAEEGLVVGAELTAPKTDGLGAELAVAEAAAILNLPNAAIRTLRHQPTVASAGLAFLLVELNDLAALAAAKVDAERLAAQEQEHDFNGVFLYAAEPSTGLPDFQARMFAPSHGVPEDPVTGSANAALGLLLASGDASPDATLSWSVHQGVEMGRPGRADITVERKAGKISEVRVAGRAVVVCRGEIEVPGA